MAYDPTVAAKRVKRITSHVGMSRYLANVKMTKFRIPRVAAIPSPYAYSPDHVVYQDQHGRCVFVVETAHKQYDVFLARDFVL